MRTAIYVRVSTLEQAEEGYSIEEQIAKLEKFCELRDWQKAGVYRDSGFSGANIDRPGISKLIKDVKNKKIDMVLVYKLDRLSRSQKDTLYLIEDVFATNGANFVSLNENFDTSTPFGKAMIGILAVFAQLEREQIMERMQMGKAGRAKAGKAMGWTRPPFGYRYNDGDYYIHELEAQIVKRIYRDYLAGTSITKLHYALNEEGHIGREIKWNYRALRVILGNPVYAGFTHYRGQVYPGNHEPIISEEDYKRTQEELHKRQQEAYAKNNNPRPFQSKYMVSGMLRCGHCGSSLAITSNPPKKDGTRSMYYRCYSHFSPKKNLSMRRAEKCVSPSYKKEMIEQAVLAEIEKLRLSPEKLDEVAGVDTELEKEVLEKHLTELDKKLEKLVGLYLDENLPLEILNERKATIQKEKQAIAKKISKLEKKKPELKKSEAVHLLNDLKGVVLELDYEQQKTLVRQLIKRVVMFADEIKIEWRFTL